MLRNTMANVGMIDTSSTSISESKVVCLEHGVLEGESNVLIPAKGEELGHVQPSCTNGHLTINSDGDNKMMIDKLESRDINGEKKECVENGNGDADQHALQDVGNKFSNAVIQSLPKKSVLKRPKSETSDPGGSASNPSKRIKIVENLDTLKSGKCIAFVENNESPEIFKGADDLASVTTEVSSCGETLRWLNSPSSSIDQSSINVDIVRDNLCPAKRNFSVEIDMRFILSDTCTAILGSKLSIAKVGASEFHLWISKKAMHNNPVLKPVVYKENFVKMANIDAILNYDLTSPRELTTETPYAYRSCASHNTIKSSCALNRA